MPPFSWPSVPCVPRPLAPWPPLLPPVLPATCRAKWQGSVVGPGPRPQSSQIAAGGSKRCRRPGGWAAGSSWPGARSASGDGGTAAARLPVPSGPSPAPAGAPAPWRLVFPAPRVPQPIHLSPQQGGVRAQLPQLRVHPPNLQEEWPRARLPSRGLLLQHDRRHELAAPPVDGRDPARYPRPHLTRRRPGL